MRKSKFRIGLLIFSGMLLLIVSLQQLAFAAPAYKWPMPSNVKIVQKGTVDNIHTFNYITAALNSITNASPTNPYVVKVMPGTYNEQVNMKSYVNVVGSGQDATVIYFAGNTGATVYMATNSTLQSLKVVYDETVSGYDAIFFRSGVGGTVVDVATHADKGIGIEGDGPTVKIVNCNIYGSSYGVGVWSFAGISPVVIISSSISSNYYGIIAAGNVVVENSTITSFLDQGVQVGDYPGNEFIARNTQINGSPAINSVGGDFKVANCQLIGGTNSVVGRDKIINCYDGNFNAIPNQ